MHGQASLRQSLIGAWLAEVRLTLARSLQLLLDVHLVLLLDLLVHFEQSLSLSWRCGIRAAASSSASWRGHVLFDNGGSLLVKLLVVRALSLLLRCRGSLSLHLSD